MEVSSSGIHAVADQAKRFSRDLFNDITNIKDTLDKIHALEAESCTQEELLSAEDHLKKLKTAYITSHSKKELYALLTNPNPLQLLNDISEDSENVIVQEQNQCKDYIQKSKEEVEQKENLASQDICNYIEGFDQLVESHNQLKTIVKEAHETYQQLKEQEDQESLDFTQTCIVQEKEQLRLQLMELNKQCAETQNKNKITEEEIVQLKKQLQDFTEDEKQTSRNLHQLDKVAVSAEQNLEMASQSDQWLHQIYASASDCNRVDSVWKDGNHYYYTIYDETQGQPNLNLTLAISYINYDTQSTITKMKITGAQVDIQDLPIDDLVEEAVERNDLIMLVSDVKRRYCNRLTFLKELKDLRSRFPVDYISSKQLLRVIIGASSNMICNFLVPCTYPAVGRISMTTMEGHTNPEIFYQANDICGTLTDWIAFLEQQVRTL